MRKNRPFCRVTMADVAREAGVSQQSVSSVLGNSKSGLLTSEETAERIRTVARKMGFIPRRTAQTLKKRDLLGVVGLSFPRGHFDENHPQNLDDPIVDQVFGPFMKETIQNLEYSLVGIIKQTLCEIDEEHRPWGVMTCDRDDHGSQLASASELGLDLVDGMIFNQPDERHLEILDYARAGFPLVIGGNLPGVDDIASVSINNFLESRRLTHHLLEIGRRRLVGFWPFDLSKALSLERYNGFLQELDQKKLVPIHNLFSGDICNITQGYYVMKDFLQQGESFDGLVAGTNLLAIGAMFAIQETGLKVPEDVAIVTFDDHLINSLVKPQLTAISLPNSTLGKICAEKLYSLMVGKPLTELRTFVECQFNIRQSSVG